MLTKKFKKAGQTLKNLKNQTPFQYLYKKMV